MNPTCAKVHCERGVVSGQAIHIVFDIAAWLTALTMLVIMRRWRFAGTDAVRAVGLGYVAAVLFGAGIGGITIGSLNLWLAGLPPFGRSIAGALLGAIVAVEIYKPVSGITTRTGAPYAAAIAAGILVGRFGCFFADLDDYTYGVPTALPIGVDFGDGVARHPVQLYESAAMALFLAIYLVQAARRSPWWLANGFYAFVAWYGAQRFILEMIKPYPTLIGPLTVFQLISLVLVLYGILMRVSPSRPAVA